VLELPPMASSQTAMSCLCTGRNASGQVALPLVVRRGHLPKRKEVVIGAEPANREVRTLVHELAHALGLGYA
jgi:hypothetical protein